MTFKKLIFKAECFLNEILKFSVTILVENIILLEQTFLHLNGSQFASEQIHIFFQSNI